MVGRPVDKSWLVYGDNHGGFQLVTGVPPNRFGLFQGTSYENMDDLGLLVTSKHLVNV